MTNPLANYIQSTGEEMLHRLEYIDFKPNRILECSHPTHPFGQALKARYPYAAVISAGTELSKLSAQPTKKFFKRIQQPLCTRLDQLPLPKNSVDMIFCNMVLHHYDLAKAIPAMMNVLEPDGLLMFSLPGPDTLIELRQALSTLDNHAHVHVFPDMHDVGDQLLKAGFKDPVMDTERLPLSFDALPHLFDSLTMLDERNTHSDRTKTLIGKQAWSNALNHYPSENGITATLETTFGHAWGNDRLQHVDDSGTAFVSLDQLRRK